MMVKTRVMLGSYSYRKKYLHIWAAWIKDQDEYCLHFILDLDHLSLQKISEMLNHVLHNEIFDWSKLKGFADDK